MPPVISTYVFTSIQFIHRPHGISCPCLFLFCSSQLSVVQLLKSGLAFICLQSICRAAWVLQAFTLSTKTISRSILSTVTFSVRRRALRCCIFMQTVIQRAPFFLHVVFRQSRLIHCFLYRFSFRRILLLFAAALSCVATELFCEIGRDTTSHIYANHTIWDNIWRGRGKLVNHLCCRTNDALSWCLSDALPESPRLKMTLTKARCNEGSELKSRHLWDRALELYPSPLIGYMELMHVRCLYSLWILDWYPS